MAKGRAVETNSLRGHQHTHIRLAVILLTLLSFTGIQTLDKSDNPFLTLNFAF